MSEKKKIDRVSVLAAMLVMAWGKYERTFAEPPRGTLGQMQALLELAGGEKAIKRFQDYKP